MIWRDQQHFDEWVNLARTSEDVRVVSLPSTLVPIALPDGHDHTKMAVVGIAFGVQADYTDTVLKYYMVVDAVNQQL